MKPPWLSTPVLVSSNKPDGSVGNYVQELLIAVATTRHHAGVLRITICCA